MPKMNPLLDNCKPRRVHLDNERISELDSSLDEMLEPAAEQRIMSYQQALQTIRQFTYVVKDCNFVGEPDN